MKAEERARTRRAVTRTAAWTTVLFIVGLALGLSLQSILPLWRLDRVENLISRGDYARAREAVARLDDEARAEDYLTECDYLEGKALLSAGDPAGARDLFARAGEYADAETKVKECDYRLADAMAAAEDFDGAIRGFQELGGYRDAAERLLESRYAKAAALLSAGEKPAAAAEFALLGEYLDSAELLVDIAVELTGLRDPEEALAAFQGHTGAEWDHILALEQVRSALPRGIIAVGFAHTVGLSADGTVLSCGDDAWGQCGLRGLGGVTAVAAGAYHSAALLSDGTVRTAGRNTEGQCGTAGWRNVVAVAAADYATFGLTADGRLLCAGVNDYREPSGWSGLDMVRGGSYNLGVRRTDGTVLTSPALDGLDALTGACDLAVNTGCAVGVMNDGRTVCTAFDLSDWKEMLAVSGSSTAILGLDAGGRVRGYFFRDRDAVPVETFTDVVAVAAGGTHHALVFSDGSVTVLGDTSLGQGDTAGWRLAVSP